MVISVGEHNRREAQAARCRVPLGRALTAGTRRGAIPAITKLAQWTARIDTAQLHSCLWKCESQYDKASFEAASNSCDERPISLTLSNSAPNGRRHGPRIPTSHILSTRHIEATAPLVRFPGRHTPPEEKGAAPKKAAAEIATGVAHQSGQERAT